VNAVLTTMLLGLRLFWRSGRGLLWALATGAGLLGPAVLYHLARMASQGHLKAGGHSVYLSVMGVVVPMFVMPLGAVLLGLAMVRDDEESGAALALVLRPVARWKLMLGRYLGGVLSLWLPLALLTPVAWLTLEPRLRLSGFQELSIHILGMLPAAAAAVAVATCISLVFKKPLVPLVFWGFGYENATAWLPGHIKDLTVQFHLRTLIGRAAGGKLATFFARSESPTAAVLFLLLWTALPLAAALWLYRRRQYTGGGE